MSRIEKSKKNIVTGLIYQVLYLIFTFVIRFVMIRYAGINALSINSLLIEVITVLSVAELGVWIAISYHLYLPLAQNNQKKITAIMHMFRRTYTIIGFAILGIGLVFMPFAPRLLKDIEVETGYFLTAYILVLLKSVIPYFFTYKMALLNADQKSYIYMRVNIIVQSVFFVLELLSLILTKNLLVYLGVDLVCNVVINAITARICDKEYPYLKEKIYLQKEERKTIFTGIRRVFVGRVSNKVLNSTDNILISTIVSTVMVGVYSQYSMFTNGFLRLFSQIDSALNGTIGNITATESKERCREVYQNITYLFFVLALFVGSCFYVGVGPFLIGVVGRDYTLHRTILLLVTTNLFLEILKMPLWTFYNANGMFRSDQLISVAGCILNIVLSIVLGLRFGMIGIFIGTLASLLLMASFKLVNLYKTAFCSSRVRGFWDHVLYVFLFAAALTASGFASRLTQSLPHIAQFILNCLMAAGISIVVACVPYIKTERQKFWRGLLFDQVNKVFHRPQRQIAE